MPASKTARVRARRTGLAPDDRVPGMSGCTSPSVSDGVAWFCFRWLGALRLQVGLIKR